MALFFLLRYVLLLLHVLKNLFFLNGPLLYYFSLKQIMIMVDYGCGVL